MKINYIQTNSNLIMLKIDEIIKNSSIHNKKQKCNKCNKIFENTYHFKSHDEHKKSNKLIITDLDIHILKDHNIINFNLYKKIALINLSFSSLNYCLVNTNSLYIMNGLYEEGSNNKYIDNNKTIYNSKKNRYSEHSGFIYFKNNKIDKVIVLNNSRTDKNDPTIYLPKNSLESLTVDYIYHTHPKTPYLGSRIDQGIIYEFPSISDIIHFVEHHNDGKLLGSIIIAPEGYYIIHKYNFNRDKIRLDYDILMNELEYIYNACYSDSLNRYSDLDIDKLKIDKYVKIPDKYFYENISQNFEYINNINKVLSKYDIYIDYYPRIQLSKTDYWVIPDIYVPIIS